mgnify:CR=1 FL=1
MDTLKTEALKQGRWRLGEDGYIEKGAYQPSKDDVILSGPMIFVGDPFYKTARREFKGKEDYDVVDHSLIGQSWLQFQTRMADIEGR